MRICVEIDLIKRVLSKFKLLGRTYRVKYERLHFIYFNYNKYGHRKEICPKIAKEKVVNTNKVQGKQPFINLVKD